MSIEETAQQKASAAYFNSLKSGGGNAIGKRGTPYFSYWPMQDKWKKYGKWWGYIGRDGDVMGAGHKLEIPMVIELFYVKLTDNVVVQFAWERPDLWQRWQQGIEPSLNIIGERMAFVFNR